jgi:transposase
MIFLPSLRFSDGGINAMRAGIRISSLVPSGLAIESVSDSSDSIILAVRSEAGMAECPLCGSRSRRIHSRYDRQVADLPSAGKQIRLRVITRRFVCEVPHCRRRIFAERFGDNVLPTRSRRTARLESSSTIWDWHSAADQQRVSPGG